MLCGCEFGSGGGGRVEEKCAEGFVETSVCLYEVCTVLCCDFVCFGGLVVFGRFVADSVEELLGKDG